MRFVFPISAHAGARVVPSWLSTLTVCVAATAVLTSCKKEEPKASTANAPVTQATPATPSTPKASTPAPAKPAVVTSATPAIPATPPVATPATPKTPAPAIAATPEPKTPAPIAPATPAVPEKPVPVATPATPTATHKIPSAYDSWAKLKPGSSVTLKTTTEAAGQKTEISTTYVLNEVTPEKAVLDVQGNMVVAGNSIPIPARKQDVPAASAVTTTGTPAVAGATPDVKQSEETVTIDGKDYKCHVTESTVESNGTKVKSKTWTCPEVPNLLVKSQSASEGAFATKSTMELTKIDLK